MNTRANRLLWFVIIVLLFAAAAGCSPRIERVPPSGQSINPLPTLTPNATPQPQLLERRLLVLEWPQTMREKDSDLIVLSITMDESGRVTPTVAIPEPNDEDLPVEIPDLYETHNIVAIARLDMAGLDADRSEMREPLRPGRTVTFRWSVRAAEAGRYRGVVWLHIEMVPKAGGEVEEILLLARPIEINAVTVLGMPGDLARILGMLGVFISTVIGYPFIQKWIENWQKRRQNASRQPPAAPQPPHQGRSEETESTADPTSTRPGSV